MTARHTRRRPLASVWAYGLIAPAMLVFLVFSIFPSVVTVMISLFDWNWLNTAMSEFVGLENYRAMLAGETTPSFWSTLRISFVFIIAIVVFGTAISLAIAMLLRRSTRIAMFGRAAVFIAYVTPQVATSIAWIWMYNDRFGVLNALLSAAGLPRIDWLGNPGVALVAIIIYTLWNGTGFTMMIFLGGITTLSTDQSEAARLDGANAWQEFWHVTLPQLRPFVTFVVIITSIHSLQAFTQFFVMTSGGPGYVTSTLGFEVYRQAFVTRSAGYAAALAVVLFAITAIMSAAQMRISRRLSL
ncbi:carbohydrate ABC transporter permease [Microbacterium indicum]|uniref:carbohydrate ABC transporter permease n=1 Tax=Microbacterium indicum TaxID=358100 RepID=UPI00048E3942|nr:sugar ABC transporter permease [Microbacterium indicum]